MNSCKSEISRFVKLSIMCRVCDTTIDPMNRYNGHYSLYYACLLKTKTPEECNYCA